MWGTLRQLAEQVQKDTLSGLATANEFLDQLDNAVEDNGSDEDIEEEEQTSSHLHREDKYSDDNGDGDEFDQSRMMSDDEDGDQRQSGSLSGNPSTDEEQPQQTLKTSLDATETVDELNEAHVTSGPTQRFEADKSYDNISGLSTSQDLHIQVKELYQKLELSEQAKRDLENEVSELLAARSQSLQNESRIKELEEENSRLNTELKSSGSSSAVSPQESQSTVDSKSNESEIQMLKESYEQRIQHMITDATENNNTITRLRSRISSLETELESTIASHQMKDTTYASTVDSLNAKIASLESELESERRTITSMNLTLQTQVDMESEFSAARETYKSRILQLESELKQKEEFILLFETKEESLSSEVARLKAKVEVLESALASAERDMEFMSQTEKEMNATRDTQLSYISSLEADMKSSTDKLKSVTLRCAALDAEVSALQNSTTKIQDERELLEEKLKEKTFTIEKLEVENSDLNNKVNEDASIIRRLEDRMSSLELELVEHKNKFNDASQAVAECEQLRSRLLEVESKLDKYEQKKKKDLESLKRQNERISTMQREHEEEIECAQGTIDTLTSRCRYLETKVVELENSQLVSDKDDRIADLEQRIADCTCSEQRSSQTLQIKYYNDSEKGCTVESPDLSPLSRSVAGSSASEGEGSVGSGEGSFVVLKTSAKSVKECDSMGGSEKSRNESADIAKIAQERIEALEKKAADIEKERISVEGELKSTLSVLKSRDEFIEELQEERKRLEVENKQLTNQLRLVREELRQATEVTTSSLLPSSRRQRQNVEFDVESGEAGIESRKYVAGHDHPESDGWGGGSPPVFVALWNMLRKWCPCILRWIGDRPPTARIILISYAICVHLVVWYLYRSASSCYGSVA